MVSTQDATTAAATTPAPAEQRLTLYDVTWETYEKLLEAHENPSDVIGTFIRILVVESGLNLKSMASTTLKRPELQKGAEPDRCYYIQNEALVRGKTVDLNQDPPPDLVVEVDITHTDIDKNRLYAQLGVPELWRYDGKVLRIFQLEEGGYREVEVSPTFPWLPKGINSASSNDSRISPGDG